MSGSFIKTVKDLKLAKSNDLLFIPRVTEWLSEHAELEMTNEVIELVVDILADESNSIRDGRFGSSSRGTCKRQQIFTYLGIEGVYSTDYLRNNIFLDGHWRHLRWQLVGLESGALTHVEVPFSNKGLRLTGSIDGANYDEEWIFELKGAFQFPKEVPTRHLYQIHTYFLGTGLKRCAYVVENKQTQEFKEWVVVQDNDMMKQVRKELDDLNRAVEKQELPAPLHLCERQEGPEYKKCPFAKTCLKQQEWPDSEWN